MFNFAIINYVFIESVFLTILMWIVAARLTSRNYKLMLLATPLIFIYLLFLPTDNLLGVLLFAGFLMLLRRYLFGAARDCAARQVVVIFVIKYLAVYAAAFVALFKPGLRLTTAHLQVAQNGVLAGWALFYLIIISAVYRIVVNRLQRKGYTNIFGRRQVVIAAVIALVVTFAILNGLYHFLLSNVVAIAAITGLGLLLVVLIDILLVFIVRLALIVGNRLLF